MSCLVPRPPTEGRLAVPILDVLMAEARDDVANDPAWRFNEEGVLDRESSRYIYHLRDLLEARITTTEKAKAVMAELIEHWSVPWDTSVLGGDDWIEWIITLANQLMQEYLESDWMKELHRRPLNYPILPYPEHPTT